jgi:hypothetical protein
MRNRFVAKLLQQSMLESAEDEFGEHVLHNHIVKYIRANKVIIGMNSKKGLYFHCYSAYSLGSFLMTPCDNAMHGTAEDNFNFFHSSSRIVVECAFGEIDL